LKASLVIQTSFLGDVVLTTPLLAELANRGPVDVITTPAAAPLLANHPAVRQVIPYDKRGRDSGPLGLMRLARRIRDGQYSSAYLAQGSWRSGLLATMGGVAERIGFDGSGGKMWYTTRIRHIRDQHHAERLWRLAVGDDVSSAPPEAMRPRLYPDDADRAAVDALLRDVPRDGAKLLALAPGSRWGTKRWPHFPALAARLAPLYRLVVIGSPADSPLADEIAARTGRERLLDATGKLSLLGSAALISRCAALVTNDSAPLHLASAMGTPTVAIFGPTVPAFGFGPLAPRRAIAEVAGLACRPCHAHGPQRCPLGHFACMQELDASRVLDDVMRVTVPA
jgi:heptosyltransferase-2